MPTAVAVFLLLLSAQPAGDEAARASGDWIRCGFDELRPILSRTDAPEAIADAALAGCRAQEERFRQAYVRAEGATRAAAGMPLLRENIRDRLIEIVNRRRGLVPPRHDEAAGYGSCIAEQARALKDRPEPAEQLADVVLERCAAIEAAMRARAVREDGEEIARRAHLVLREHARETAIRRIRQAREGR